MPALPTLPTLSILPKLSHLDHGLTPAHVEWLLAVAEPDANDAGITVATIGVPDVLSALEHRLYGPMECDGAIAESEARYIVRPGRSHASRVVDRPARATRRLTFVAGPHGDLPFVLYTAYGGSAAPREPGDRTIMTFDALAEARLFWSTHALGIL